MITYIILSLIIILFTILDYKREKEFKKHLIMHQNFLVTDSIWSEKVDDRLIEIDNWIKEHDRKEKKK